MILRTAIAAAVATLALGTGAASAACPVELTTAPCPADEHYSYSDYMKAAVPKGIKDWYVTVGDFNARLSIPEGAGALVPHDPVLDDPHYAEGAVAYVPPVVHHRAPDHDAKGRPARVGKGASAWSGHRKRMAFGR